MSKYTVRAYEDKNAHDVNIVGVYRDLGNGAEEWVADFRSMAAATVFSLLMERQGTMGEWRDRVMREVSDNGGRD